MGTFEVTGMEDVELMLLNHEEKAGTAVPLMLQAGAQVMVETAQSEAKAQGIYKTGGFIKSIQAGNIQSKNNEKYVLVYPQGSASHGNDYANGKAVEGNVRYAMIGSINEVGTSIQPARPWYSASVAKGVDKANKAMQDKWEELKNG